MAGEDGHEPGRPHLDRLLHHVIEPCMLERGEQVVQIEREHLRPLARFDR